MRKLLQALVIVAVASSFAHADSFMYFKKKAAAAGGGGYVLKDSQTTDNEQSGIFDAAGTAGVGTSFTTTSAYTLTKAEVKLTKANSPTGNITARIHSDATNMPGTIIGTSTNTIDASAIVDNDFTSAAFLFSGVSLSNATKYHVTLSKDSTDASNYVRWRLNYNTVTGQRLTSASNPTTVPWTTTMLTTTQGNFKAYATE